jgi:hypothetical protein
LHSSAGSRIQHPCRHHDDGPGRQLDVNNLATGALFDILAPNATTIECVPAILDLDLLPDMGRMTGQLPWEDATGSSPAVIPAASAPRCTRSCRPRN